MPIFKEPTNYHSRIKDWPVLERPREKLLAQGAESLSDAELLAILIGSGIKNITAVDLGKKMLIDTGTIQNLASKTISEIKRYPGMGSSRTAILCAAFELSRRLAVPSHIQQAPFHSPEEVYGYFSPRLRDLKREVFIVLILSSANKLIRWLTITEGTLNSSLVHPREVFKHAINELAASVILIHNHPSGIATPSDEDRMVTKQLVEAGKIIGIPVQDHVIIGSGQYYSFAESGIL